MASKFCTRRSDSQLHENNNIRNLFEEIFEENLQDFKFHNKNENE